jgi:hypothetical protein
VLGLASAVIVVLIYGLSTWLSNGVQVGLSNGPISGLRAGLRGVLIYGPIYGPIYGLIYGLIFGLFMGGWACLRHYVLRLLLWHAGAMPWNYSRFLDYAAEHILLRKVGGGYIFVHRLLLEYFATLDTTAAPDATSAKRNRQSLPSRPLTSREARNEQQIQ